MNQVKESLPAPASIPCSVCRIGQMRPAKVTYFAFARGRMITIPDFSAWKCDICGKCEFDIDALDQLALLLNPPIRTKDTAPHGKSAGDSLSPKTTLPK
jgi:YgiT-type zinc finger domain-containing protein